MSKFFNSEKKVFYHFILALFLTSIILALLTYHVENLDNPGFSRPIDGFFWWIATITTAGAGTAPHTDLGKIFGALNMLIGGILYIAILSEFVVWVKTKSEEQFSGSGKYVGSNHILILGYNELTLGLIHILETVLKDSIDIVLVSSLIDSNPKPDRVKFVKKSPLTLSTLERVSVETASVAFILGRDNIIDKKADYNAMLVAGHVEKLQKEVFTLVEISDGRRAKGFDMFEIDETFTAEELFKDLRDDEHFKLLDKLPEKIRKQILKK